MPATRTMRFKNFARLQNPSARDCRAAFARIEKKPTFQKHHEYRAVKLLFAAKAIFDEDEDSEKLFRYFPPEEILRCFEVARPRLDENNAKYRKLLQPLFYDASVAALLRAKEIFGENPDRLFRDFPPEKILKCFEVAKPWLDENGAKNRELLRPLFCGCQIRFALQNLLSYGKGSFASREESPSLDFVREKFQERKRDVETSKSVEKLDEFCATGVLILSFVKEKRGKLGWWNLIERYKLYKIEKETTETIRDTLAKNENALGEALKEDDNGSPCDALMELAKQLKREEDMSNSKLKGQILNQAEETRDRCYVKSCNDPEKKQIWGRSRLPSDEELVAYYVRTGTEPRTLDFGTFIEIGEKAAEEAAETQRQERLQAQEEQRQERLQAQEAQRRGSQAQEERQKRLQAQEEQRRAKCLKAQQDKLLKAQQRDEDALGLFLNENGTLIPPESFTPRAKQVWYVSKELYSEAIAKMIAHSNTDMDDATELEISIAKAMNHGAEAMVAAFAATAPLPTRKHEDAYLDGTLCGQELTEFLAFSDPELSRTMS